MNFYPLKHFYNHAKPTAESIFFILKSSVKKFNLEKYNLMISKVCGQVKHERILNRYLILFKLG